MSLSASQASATQKLLDHIRSTPQKDDASASFAPPLQIPPAAPLRPLFGKERSVVGIDVGKGRICLVQRRAGSTPILEAIQSFSIPETMDWETPGLADRIREALSAFLPHGGRDADIWVRLPDGQDELRHYRIPKVSPKDRDAIAKMAAIREKPFDEAENIFDYRVDAEVLDKGVPRLPVTAMIANKGAANTVRHTLAAAGVSPAGITSGNIYAQNLFASGWLSSPWEHFAFADIGEDSTRIEIFSGTNIALSRTIKTGLRSLVTALQESYGGRRKKTPPPPVVPPMPRHLPMEALGGELAGPHSERQQAVSSFTSPSDPFPLILQPESLRALFTIDTTLWRGKRVQDPYINAYRFSAVTGLRPGELIGLRWADVHGDQVCIRRAINVHGEETRGKNENALRAFTLTGTAAAILADQRLLTGAEDSVFDIQSESTYRHCWKRYCEANDIDYIPPYNLRHTFVSLAKTLPEGAVKPLVGHSRQMDTYGVYAHLLQGEEEQTALELENKLQKVLCNKPVL